MITRKTARVRYKFPDGTTEEIQLSDMEKAKLQEAAFMAKSDDHEWREWGEARLEKIAQHLAAHTLTAAKRTKATAAAAAKRRADGARKTKIVLAAVAKGQQPPVGNRQLRRIKAKNKK